MKKLVLGVLLIGLYFSVQAQPDQTDSVTVTFKVTVPNLIPKDATIYWAGSLNRWDPGNNFFPKSTPESLHQKNGGWEIKLTASKGDTVQYKYTRGSMFSVEEQDDFTYRPLRKIVFDQSKTVYDTVAAWHDRPPKGLQSNWPQVPLETTKQTISMNGVVQNGTGSFLYDKSIGSRFFDMSTLNTKVRDIPKNVRKQVIYFLKISDAPDNTVIILAGKTDTNNGWNIYIDKNNDNQIDTDEVILNILTDTTTHTWRGTVQFQKISGGSVVDDTVNIGIRNATNLPPGYRSSAEKGAPDLTYQLPFHQRKGVLNGKEFYLIAPFTQELSKFFYLAVDQNHNDTLSIGSGSNEVSPFRLNQMFQRRRFYIFPTFQLGNDFWDVVSVNDEGTSIRLKPAPNTKAKIDISPGKPAPKWVAMTTNGDKISSKSLIGKYVLLNFWGSWCGGCVQEIPKLRRAYKKFKSDKFEIVGFDYGDNRRSFKHALTKYAISWPQVRDKKGNYKTKFSVFGFPANFLIGPEGKVLETEATLRGEKLIPTLEKYLK